MDEDSPVASRNHSPSPEENPLQQSFDILISKHLIPPPLMLLPKPVSHQPKSLTPMIPLPPFLGIIPNFQPLDKPIPNPKMQKDYLFSWIGEAFEKVIYQKYEEESYKKIENIDENWNIWACDIAKMSNRKSAEESAAAENPIHPFYTKKNGQDKTLIFESRFECGNLSMAAKVSDRQYNLLLQNDINTNGYSQWFFFKVTNTQRDLRVKFKILNQYKLNNLYKMGMKIIMYSKRESQEKNLSWHRAGENIEYYENGYSKSSYQYKPFFTLSWEHTFTHDEDEVYFAYSYPYTYSNLQNFFFKVESDTLLRNICQRSMLCKTLAGNRVDILTITEHHSFLEIEKPYILITARIHPGESVSSYVCNGIVEFLLSNDPKAKQLRQNFIFKIIPMINPDGVIHGNYRSNISGYDLNKKWDNPSQVYHPEIFYLKKLILSIQEIGEVVLFCDLHGHSMKKNMFVYGCHDTMNPKKGKQFPLLMSKIFKSFSFKDCSFLDKEEEEGTSRTFLSKQLRHCDIYALQSSFCGPEHENIHYTVRHFQELGQKFCEALLIYFNEKIKGLHVEAVMQRGSALLSRQEQIDSFSSYEKFKVYTELDEIDYDSNVKSEYSQMSEEEVEAKNVLDQQIIKKYLLMKYMRPGVNHLKRSNINIRKSQSKDLVKLKLGDFLTSNPNAKSNSPVKRRQLYETPQKVQRPKIVLKFTSEKKEIQPKMFQPQDFIQANHKHRRSSTKMSSELPKEKPVNAGIRIVLNKNFQFKERSEEQGEPIFKNNFLKGVGLEEAKSEKKMNEFIIRKKNPYGDERSSVSLFNSVLSSLRKDKK